MRAIWRQSSEPIEPPAPVTSTVSSTTYLATVSRSTSTCSRPSTSSTWTGRICPVRSTSPAISSCRPGSVFTGTPAARAASTTRWRVSPGADGIAISTSSGCCSRSIRHRSAVVPSTRTPWTRRPCFRGSSSTSPIGVVPAAGDFSISLTITWAASPAPTTITSLPRATRPLRDGRSRIVRASIREPARMRAAAASP